MTIKVVVIVRGGNVQDCYADLDDIEIEMIDFDNISEESAEAVERAEARLKDIVEKMHHVY